MPSARTLRAGRAVIELSLLTGDVEKQLKKLEARMKNFGKAMSSIGSAGLKFSGAIAGLLAFPVKMAADLEKTRAEFTALIGDAAQANKLVSDIEGLALVSPLGTADLGAAARTLLGFEVALEDVMPRLRQLGDVSGGDAERLGRLALAFGQMSGKGRLMGQELNQMIEQGFNPLSEISRKTGETIGELQARMEAGGVSAAEVGDAFESVTESGGRFEGMMKSIGDTTIGKFNALKESISATLRPIGDVLLPLLKEWMDRTAQFIPRLQKWISENKDSVTTIAKVAGAVGLASGAMLAIGSAMAGAALVLNPFAIAVGALVGAYFALDKILDKVNKTLGTQMKAFDVLFPQIALLRKLLPEGTIPDFANLFPETVKGGSPATLGLGSAMEMAGLPRAMGGVTGPQSNNTIDVDAIANALLMKARATSMNIQGAIGKELSGVQVFADGAQMHLDRARDILAEQQAVEDQINRTRIDAMRDGVDKEKALIDHEHAIRLRELQERNLLTDELKGKLLELQGVQVEGLKGLDLADRHRQQEAVFDTRLAAQMFGGNEEHRQTQLMERQLAELKGIRKQDNGINVV